MSDNKRYYYLKLKENFFDSDEIVLMESMPDGICYSNILLKLYLKSLKKNGRLELSENIPYTPQMIATLTRQSVGTVEKALDIFEQLGLVELMPNGGYYMSNIELFIGQSSTEGERRKAARQRLKAAQPQKLPCGQMSGQMSVIRPPDIDIEKEIEIESDLESEKELDLEKGHPPYGTYRNVFLTEKSLEELTKEFPDRIESLIERLSCYMKSTGKNYADHSATLRLWAEKDIQEGKKARQGMDVSGNRDYSCGEEDSL